MWPEWENVVKHLMELRNYGRENNFKENNCRSRLSGELAATLPVSLRCATVVGGTYVFISGLHCNTTVRPLNSQMPSQKLHFSHKNPIREVQGKPWGSREHYAKTVLKSSAIWKSYSAMKTCSHNASTTRRPPLRRKRLFLSFFCAPRKKI